ncbi:MAG: DUF4350 domain-containing protein, partial [Streptosporangiaceae bacterium]
MTAPAQDAPAHHAPAQDAPATGRQCPAGDSASASRSRATARWRPWRTPIAIGAFVLLAVIAVALLRPSPTATGYLSPQGTDALGARAIADIMAGRGHHVQTVTTAAAAVSAAGPGTTLVITSPSLLTAAQARALGRARGDLIIIEPDQATLGALAPALTLPPGGATTGLLLAPGCSLPAARLAGTADLGGAGLSVSGPAAAGMTQCYPENGNPMLVQFRSAGRLVTVLSSGKPLANAYLALEGNAALAINLLSEAGPIVWLVPAIPAAPAVAAPRSFASLVPLAAYLVLAQLGVALLLTALWRARRLGPLAVERLPVIVRACETVEGHARLYQSRRARDRVAAELRGATIGRLMPAVGLPT